MNWKKFSPLIYVIIVALFLPDAYAGRLQKFEVYLDQLGDVSGSSIHPAVRKHLIKVHKDKTYGAEEVSEASLKASHKDFKKRKNALIKQWEEKMGIPWPRYTHQTQCVMNKTCIKKQKGQRYDAHHIIPQSHKGPNKWWNLIPLDVRDHNRIHGMRVKTQDGSYSELQPPYCCDQQLFPHSCVGYRGTH